MSEERRMPRTAWKKGQSGNPKGKPCGARNHATRMVMGLLEDGAAEVAKVIVDAAKAGDLAAARLVIERLAPPIRERPIDLPLPDTATAEGINKAQQIILEAVANGVLLPGEATTLAGIVESRRKALETQELEARIAVLEEMKK